MVIIGGRAHDVEQVRAVGELGLPFAEVSLLAPERVRSDLKELLDLRDRYGLRYLAHYPNEDNPTDAEVLRDRFVPRMKELLSLSRELGIEKGTLHFWMDRRWASADLLLAKTRLLADMTASALDLGVRLCLENLTERHDSFSEVFAAVPDLRMTLDIGHGELLASVNTSHGFIEHLFPWIQHVHVHDNHGGTGVEDDLHLALGEGRIDFPAILSRLAERGYDATVTMEVKPEDMPRTKQAAERYLCRP